MENTTHFDFLDLTPEEQVEDLARYISQLKKEEGENPPYLVETLKLLADNKTDEIASRFVSETKILLTAPFKELEGVFNLLISFLKKVKKPADLNNLILKILENFSSLEISSKATYYLNVLGNIYSHLDPNSPIRFDVYIALLKFASKHHRLHLVQSGFENIGGWLDKWNTELPRRRELYLLIREILISLDRRSEAYEFLLKYLRTFENASSVAEAKDHALQAVKEALDLPEIFQVDELLELKAVQQLKGEASHNLLLIFAFQGYKEYLQFYQSNKETIEKLGLSHDKNLKKLRLITLATLAAEQTAESISYKDIAQALEIDENQVEKWIIDGIRFKLIEAKLDQLQRVVTVSKTTYRVFGTPQWEQLKQKLDLWKSSVNEILQVIQNAKIAAAQVAPAGIARTN